MRSHLSADCARNESEIDFVVYPRDDRYSPEKNYRRATEFLFVGCDSDTLIATYIDEANISAAIMRVCTRIASRALATQCLAITPLDGDLAPSLDHVWTGYVFRHEWNVVECVWFTRIDAWCMRWGTYV